MHPMLKWFLNHLCNICFHLSPLWTAETTLYFLSNMSTKLQLVSSLLYVPWFRSNIYYVETSKNPPTPSGYLRKNQSYFMLPSHSPSNYYLSFQRIGSSKTIDLNKKLLIKINVQNHLVPFHDWLV